MAKSGRGTKIGKFTVVTEAGEYACEKRVEKTDSGHYFSASCPDLGLSVGGRFAKPELDLDECIEALTKEVKATVAVEWKPHYYLRFQGAIRPFTRELPRTGGRSGLPNGSLELMVDYVELAEVPAGKVHRYCLRKYASDEAEVHDGWPEEGLSGDDEHRYGRRATPPEERAMRALIPVTPETTKAINALLDGIAVLRARFKEFLAPEAIHRSLAQLLSQPTLLAITAAGDGQNSPRKDRP